MMARAGPTLAELWAHEIGQEGEKSLEQTC